MSETIFAPATAPGRAGIAVIRISGPDAAPAIHALTGKTVPDQRVATLRRIMDPDRGEVIDRGLVLWFPGPASFTGEDVAELHLHGGRAVVEGVLKVLGRQPGLVFAEAGGFARQAFRNGKLDLTEVEALADLINAETAAQRRQAERQLAGELGRLYLGWRERLIRTQAYLEAYLDFPEDDLPAGLIEGVRTDIDALGRDLAEHLSGANRGERLRDGLRIAVVGAPNAGKSSLVNALARREVAIVAPEPGTTRDVIEVALDLDGFPVTVMDTAGLRAPVGGVEAEGIRRALARAEDADLRLGVIDATATGNATPEFAPELAPELAPQLAKLLREGDIIAVNKMDLVTDGAGVDPAMHEQFPHEQFAHKRFLGGHVVAVSAASGDGLENLCSLLAKRASELLSRGDGPMVPTRARHRLALEACGGHLARAAGSTAIELMAEDLRMAARELGRIVGIVDVEDILDVVFRELCIGK